MTNIILPALAMGAVGLGLGAVLTAASKVFKIETDERVEKITECLPGANCGGCGYAGCSGYAAAIVEGSAEINCCASGGQKAVDRIAEIMGVEAAAMEPVRAVVMCAGSSEAAPDKYEYYGVNDCFTASRLQGGGHKACGYGCLGYGSCISVCTHDAISIVDGIAVVDKELCGGCGACAKVCPKGIIQMVPKKNKIYVKCKSCDKGAAMKQKCSAGCIGCRMCEKACESGAITVTDNLASIDYSKCTLCGLCAEKCPRKIILVNG